MKSIEKQILSATKTLNSRLRRLRKEDLPTAAEQRIDELKLHKPGFVTGKDYISSSTAGLSERQKTEKLKIIRGLLLETETVKQARENVERKMKQWNVNKEEANRRIRAGRVFYQVLGYQNGLFESDDVHDAITEFDSTPDFNELLNKLFRDHGIDLQNEVSGREELLKWMNDNQEIPAGVDAIYNHDTGVIEYI